MGLISKLKEVPNREKKKSIFNRRILAPALLSTFLTLPFVYCDSTTEPEINNPPKKNPPTQPTNQNPRITSSPIISVDEHGFYEYEVKADDPDGDAISYSLTQKPSWLSVSNNYVYGRAPEVLDNEDFPVTLKVSDGKGGSDTQSFSLSVNNISNTYVVTQNANNPLSSVDSNSVTFSQEVDFNQGDFIVADTTQKTPEGFLRRIIGISQDGKTLQTEQGSLEEAVGKGNLSYTATLQNPNLSYFTSLEGISMFQNASTSPFEFGINLENVVLYDFDGDPSTTGDQLIANGNIEFNLDLSMDIDIEGRKLRNFDFNNNIEINSDITLGSNVVGIANTQEINLAEYYFSPIVIPIGAIPLVVVPKLNLGVGINPTRINPLSVNVSQNTSLETILDYDGNWNASGDFNSEFNFSNPVFSGDWDLRVYAGPRLKMLLYGVAGPFSGVSGFLGLDSSQSEWELYAGISASAGVSTEILGRGISPYAKTVFDHKEILVRSDTSNSLDKIFYSEAFYSGGYIQNEEIFSVNPDGTERENLTRTSNTREKRPFPFPDKTKIAYIQEGDVWMLDLISGNRTNLTNTSNVDEYSPTVSPDGTKIAYTREGDIWVMDVNGGNQHNLTQTSSMNEVNLSWANDGEEIVFDAYTEGSSVFDKDIYKIQTSTGNITRLTTDRESNNPSWSPTEDLIAYISRRCSSGTCGNDIYIMNSNGVEQTRVTENYHNIEEYNISWSPDGNKITYREIMRDGSGEFILWVVDKDGMNNTQVLSRAFIGPPKWSS